MAFYIAQFLTGLASAASLFLVASGLSIIFGVTRIVNFAHGAFYMLGAYVAFTLTETLSGALGFWGGIVAAALIVAGIGVLVEMVLLRRIYHAPELFQLLATFGLTLMVEDLVVLIWGPSDLLGRRADRRGARRSGRDGAAAADLSIARTVPAARDLRVDTDGRGSGGADLGPGRSARA